MDNTSRRMRMHSAPCLAVGLCLGSAFIAAGRSSKPVKKSGSTREPAAHPVGNIGGSWFGADEFPQLCAALQFFPHLITAAPKGIPCDLSFLMAEAGISAGRSKIYHHRRMK